MKKIIASIALLVVGTTAMAQSFAVVPPVKKIEVTGTAEMEVTPDEIYLNISLKEFFRDNGNKNKVDIETLEKQLQKAVLDAGIPKESFMINNIYGYNYDQWWNKKKDQNFLARKQYRLKLNKLDKVNAILSAVDPKGIESVNVAEFSHSKIAEFRKELKMKAIKDAKDKATYLLSAIGEQVSGVLEVYDQDNSGGGYRPQPMMSMKIRGMADESAVMPEIDFKTIKLRADVRAVFSIK
ncbi:SIMPL domain-containing protein [Solitalea koreensis]|uniref:SIMPL domain-containing protein n=1 Tax=Solitalea koreensis TaxID=543615 RepID=A0A521AS96_9SPHI|nr:SIMPL domain-containing protein [Solitalea koreensis]SMO37656.1 hypothetical protein SAMN06265350_101363 [Solitalea koreensis]